MARVDVPALPPVFRMIYWSYFHAMETSQVHVLCPDGGVEIRADLGLSIALVAESICVQGEVTGRRRRLGYQGILLNDIITLILFQVALIRFRPFPRPPPHLLKDHPPAVLSVALLLYSSRNPLKSPPNEALDLTGP